MRPSFDKHATLLINIMSRGSPGMLPASDVIVTDMQDQSCSQRFLRVNIDSTAEHSRSSGVFSRRRVAVNGSAAARPVTLCRGLSRWRRAPAPDDTL